ncbi:MAG: PPOX class F420-dependent oxidoreductase [Chloroflexales bacterium]|nr:PPOX class F420-dependent oxidoreductase [Chloroflexales bacterium]
MQHMTTEEYRSFLLDRPRTGKLATVRQDGRPHVVPIWFDLDGDTLVFTTWHTSVKVANMQHDPRVAICVDEETPPFDFVLIEGVATITDDAQMLRHWATRIASRYMGIEQAEAYGKRNSVAGELLVRVKPAKVVAQKKIAE